MIVQDTTGAPVLGNTSLYQRGCFQKGMWNSTMQKGPQHLKSIGIMPNGTGNRIRQNMSYAL